jgi:hypothetical protein
VAATAAAAQAAVDGHRPHARPPAVESAQRELAERLRAAAALLTPGWLGAPLDAVSPSTPPGGQAWPEFVRIGTAQPLDDATFPAVAPLGHVAFDADARDPRVAGTLRAVVLRLLATAPPGSLLIRAVDAAGTVFAPFAPLHDAGIFPPPVTDQAGVQAVLAEAEQWVRGGAGRAAQAARHQGRQPHPPDGEQSRGPRPARTLLLAVASWPLVTEAAEMTRLLALAEDGPAAGLHLLVAGWPPPPLSAHTTRQPLPHATQVSLRNPYALLGHPPGGSFATPVPAGQAPSAALNAQVFLDPAPPHDLIDRVCRELATTVADHARVRLGDLLPGDDVQLWTANAATGLETVVGRAGDAPVVLRLGDMTPHWMVGGRSGSGKTAFIIGVLYGLCTRYGPDQLTVYLLDFKEGVSFAEFTPTPRDPSYLPHARAVGIESDREYGVAVLRELDAEMTARSEAFKAAGVSRFADLRAAATLGAPSVPRILCVIDEFQTLLTGGDRLATEAVTLLESLARKGRSYGIHLLLASQTTHGVEALYGKRDSIFGQFPVRIALPGGSDVLDPANDAAAGLPLGTAVVNTAGGLGGPRGAIRAHEQAVRFPDPHADPVALEGLRHRLWRARPAGSGPPHVFAGFAPARLEDDPVHRAARPGSGPASVLLGRRIDVPQSTAAFPLDGAPGRHLAVLGPSSAGAGLLAAAVRSLAAQHAAGTVRFALAPLVPEAAAACRALREHLSGHRVELLDQAGVAAALDHAGGPGYLVLFGADAAELPYPPLRALLRDGPAAGRHLLGWWRGLRRFTEQTGGSAGREDVAGLVLLNLPASDAALLLAAPVDWRPRPHRALLHDRHRDRTEVIVPFAAEETAGTGPTGGGVSR